MHSALRQIKHATRKQPNGIFAFATALIGCCSLAGCGSAALATGKVAELALNAVGIQIPTNASVPRLSKVVDVRIRGAENLNADADGRGLSTVVRLYKLRDQTGFLSLPYTDFGSNSVEKTALGTDLVDAKEVILMPGKTLDFQEKMAPDVHFLGIVALFRSPDPRRWRVAFALADAEHSSVAIDVHACAMTSDDGILWGATPAMSAPLPAPDCK